MAVTGLVRFEDQRGAIAVLGEVAVEAIDGKVELAVRVPVDVEIIFVERPVARFCRELVPGQAARLVEPEAVGIGLCEVLELGELARTDASVEIFGDRVDRVRHRPLLMSMTKR